MLNFPLPHWLVTQTEKLSANSNGTTRLQGQSTFPSLAKEGAERSTLTPPKIGFGSADSWVDSTKSAFEEIFSFVPNFIRQK